MLNNNILLRNKLPKIINLSNSLSPKSFRKTNYNINCSFFKIDEKIISQRQADYYYNKNYNNYNKNTIFVDKNVQTIDVFKNKIKKIYNINENNNNIKKIHNKYYSLNNQDFNNVFNKQNNLKRKNFINNLLNLSPDSNKKKIKLKNSILIPNKNRNKNSFFLSSSKILNKNNSNFTFKIGNESFLNHEISTNYLINKYLKENLEKKVKFKIKSLEIDFDEAEFKDKFNDFNYYDIKLLEKIKNFLRAKDSKFNQEKINLNFYKNFQNRVNFLFDMNIIPCFKNNLNKKFINEKNQICNNFIEPGIAYYLNQIRVEKQKKIDEKNKNLLIQNKNDNKNDNNNNNNNNKENIENSFEKLKNQILNEIIEDKKEKIIELENKENRYEFEDFFVNKYQRFENVNLCNEKEKIIIFNSNKNEIKKNLKFYFF